MYLIEDLRLEQSADLEQPEAPHSPREMTCAICQGSCERRGKSAALTICQWASLELGLTWT